MDTLTKSLIKQRHKIALWRLKCPRLPKVPDILSVILNVSGCTRHHSRQSGADRMNAVSAHLFSDLDRIPLSLPLEGSACGRSSGARCQIYPAVAYRLADLHSHGMSNCPDQTPRRAARAWSSART